jgi:hypothetical protein
VTAERQRKVKISQKILNNIAHALFAGNRKSPSIETPKQNGASSESERFEDVGTASNASIEKHGNLLVHFPHDRGKSIERSDGAIHLPAAMIRDNQAVHTGVQTAGGILRMQNALQNDGNGSVLAKK